MRTWLYQKLVTGIPELQEFYDGLTSPQPADLNNYIHQGESLDTNQVPRPFQVYTIGNNTSENLSEERQAGRQFFQIYIHDAPADYTRIDEIIGIIKRGLTGAGDPASGVMTVRYLETSRDLDDQTMNTILRYIRFQAIMED